jgi:hypothetical protein
MLPAVGGEGADPLERGAATSARRPKYSSASAPV